MTIQASRNSLLGTCAVLALVGSLAGGAAAADPVQILHSFEGEDDGGYPDTDLVMDAAGNLYGMVVEDGELGAGAVFQLTRTASGWVHSTIYSFSGGADGGQPYGGLTIDANGNLYGTAVIGGTGGSCEDGCGVAFELINAGGTWTEKVLHSFTGGTDGTGPGGPIVFDADGRLYGVTPTGGTDGFGVLFQLTPTMSGEWDEQIIHTFTGGNDGGAGFAGRMLFADNGHFYGVTTVGGANQVGTAFELVPQAGGTWDFQTIYTFQGQPGGVFPYGGVVRDAAGSLYGTTYYGGTLGVGTVYRLDDVNGTWTETVLHSFVGGRDGASSISGLLEVNGVFYGTTSEGGLQCNCGTIFKLTPNGNSWRETVVYRFKGQPGGSYPYAALIADPGGTLYGATVRGGDDNEGAVFSFKP